VPVKTVLVANRGEIAVRIIRCCRELGLRSVAVYSDADADAPHVRLADEAHRIRPAPAHSSYLDIEALLRAARDAGADAVHPGCGLLSEDAGFARAVTDARLTFVGPSAAVIALMGNKVAARAVATECGVPVPRGTGTLTASAAAHDIGFPLVVKASFGGGGRGMRVVASPDELAAAVAAAGREAAAAFGRSDVHLERYLPRARHVEVQVIGDGHGAVVHMGDRDCSVQRRHQKLVEEAPAFGLSPPLRTALHDAALQIARHVGYVGAGTVEFLVLPTGAFFFVEMNTRLQVEHGVTEMITGMDIVATQFGVADGQPLGFGQDDVLPRGNAIEARICAEDPWQDFAPAPGPVTALRLPSGPGIRNDFGVEAGGLVGPQYDSMFGKVLAHGSDREAARRRLVMALDELCVDGIPTTAPYLRTVLASDSFVAGTHDTGSVAREWIPDPAIRPCNLRDASAPSREVAIATDRGRVEIAIFGQATRAGIKAARAARAPANAYSPPGVAVAPMDAVVVAVRVAPGQHIDVGDTVAVLEAMKMEMEVRTAAAGTVDEVLAVAGAAIAAGSPLVTLT
jgi:acetyl-CoA/propionyl-CoA carboxylase biotin carboxyl carrier protein